MTGGWLGGSRGAVLMQSSGVGDCISMLSLLASCQVPALLIVTMGREAVRRRWGVAVMISLALVVVKVSTDIPTQVVPPRDGTHLGRDVGAHLHDRQIGGATGVGGLRQAQADHHRDSPSPTNCFTPITA